MNGENGQWDHKRQSEVIKNGVREQSWGFCQIHKPSHPEYYTNKIFWENKIFTNWKYQMRECWNLYKGGVKMYAPKAKNNIVWK